MAQSYEKAGVNLEAGYEVVRRIKKHVASTSRLGVMGKIGAFGGMFDLSALNVKEPVLVSGTDGVGTKLKLAFEMDKHDTIGIDAVAMCVNDVLALRDLLLAKARYVMIKLSPMLDWRKAVDDFAGTVAEVHIVSTGNECKELLLVLDGKAAGDRKSVV